MSPKSKNFNDGLLFQSSELTPDCTNDSPDRRSSIFTPPTLGQTSPKQQKNTQQNIEIVSLRQPSFLERMMAVAVFIGALAVWTKYTFLDNRHAVFSDLNYSHSWKFPATVTSLYILSLPGLRYMVKNLNVDMKALLMDCMILYNALQVLLNGWMMYSIISQLLYHGHPLVGDIHAPGCILTVWFHYMDKYLEFFDTWFMVLRGRLDQVSFLHVYHHVTIAWAWWAAICLFPGGDSYFGALLNSSIHVMMYSYYCLTLVRIKCPWKKYLTQAQLIQFTCVVIYTFISWCCIPDYERTVGHISAYIIQVGEMASLFILFTHFYRKSYAKHSIKSTIANSAKGYDDECHKALSNVSGKFIHSSAQINKVVGRQSFSRMY